MGKQQKRTKVEKSQRSQADYVQKGKKGSGEPIFKFKTS